MENIKAKAWGFLAWAHIEKLPIDTISLNGQNVNFKIINYSSAQEYIEALGCCEYAARHDGFTVEDENGAMIFYADRMSYSERNRVIAHEIGHVILGHTTYNNILGHSADATVQNAQEIEADFFALSFLAPAPVLLKMGITHPAEIARLTGLSTEDSNLVANEVQKEEKIGYSGVSVQLVENFSAFINAYLDRKRRHLLMRIAIALCVLGILLGGIVYTHSLPTMLTTESSQEPQAVVTATYYITKTGDRYHTADCRYVKGKGIPISLVNAKKEGYIPCKVCKPSVE